MLLILRQLQNPVRLRLLHRNLVLQRLLHRNLVLQHIQVLHLTPVRQHIPANSVKISSINAVRMIISATKIMSVAARTATRIIIK